jgi:ABC-type transport system involved in multi-copper enzyme maturation permease subunit
MFWSIVRFELRFQARQPLLWGMAGLFAMLAFVATVTDAVGIGGAIGSLHRNAPVVIVRMLGAFSVMAAFGVVAFVATSALRDVERGTADLVFSKPVRPATLLLARFVGSTAATALAFVGANAGLLLGSLMPWLDPERVGPIDLRPHVWGLVVLAWPSLVVLAAAAFAVATRVRHIAAVYAGLVGLLVAYFVASAFLGDLDRQPLAARLDPFGVSAFELQVRYWTIAEQNTRVPGIVGDLLWNRLLWLTLSLGAFAWSLLRFRPEAQPRRRLWKGPGVHRTPGSSSATAESSTATPLAARRRPLFTPGTAWGQFRSQAWLETRTVLRSLPFLLILAFGLINVLANMGQLDLMMGTPVWPVTYLMLLAVRAGYSFLLILILGYYAGDLVWRERALEVDGIVDALPVPTWVPLLAKLLALWIAAGVFIAAGMLGLAGHQLAQGYTRLEPWLYVQGFVVEVVPFLQIAALALFFQVVVNQKFVGYLLMVLYLVSAGALGALHFDHFLYHFAGTPSAPYSDLNRWGPFLAPVFWFDLYWSLASAVLIALAVAWWVRGSETRWVTRWRIARRRLVGPLRWAIVGGLAAFAITGAWIFWNTTVVNAYIPSDEAQRRAVEYERRYKPYRDLPQPRITGLRADVAIYPRERRAELRGTYRLVNRTAAPMPQIHLAISPRMRVRRLDLPAHRVVQDDRRLGYAIYALETPLAPGQEMTLGFDLAIENPGFVNSGPDTAVIENGSFFYVRQFPSLGYQDDRELGDPSERRRYGLPPIVRQPAIDDRAARAFNMLARDADLMDFEATVSTDADQIAIAPGDLVDERTEGDRRVFHYKAAAPIPKFFAFQSARYAVRRDRWNDVAIEVYYHPTHTYNVDRMVDGVKKSLAYLTTNISPYQHRVVRIVEFPRYARLAASFPNTIPFSESIGFIARLDGPDAIDYPFMVTTHEVAHQWFGYQVLGADVQGSSMLSESLAQYASLMVLRQEYGAAAMRRFLRYELDRYLRGRGGELIDEQPLALVENQPYIHYAKGSLAFYALQDAIGEAKVNEALRRYVAAVRFQSPPYTVSRDLLGYLVEVTPPEHRALLTDLFETITLFDDRATEATARAIGGGRYEVTVTASVRKLRADGKGVETPVPIDDWIDVGIFGADEGSGFRRGPRVLYLQKQHVTGPTLTVTTTVDQRPVRAGIDPWLVLIDRTPSDNTRAVSVK